MRVSSCRPLVLGISALIVTDLLHIRSHSDFTVGKDVKADSRSEIVLAEEEQEEETDEKEVRGKVDFM